MATASWTRRRYRRPTQTARRSPSSAWARNANTLLKDKVLFGSDYPLITPDRWLADFDTLDIKPEVRPRILKRNAIALLGLG